MPQLLPVVLTDRKSTPVTHTFTPRGITGGVAELVETTGVPIGESRLTLSVGKSSRERYKALLKFEVPVVQIATVNGIDSPLVVRKAYAECMFSFDAKSSEQERSDLIGLVQSALAADIELVNDAVAKLEGIY